MDRPLSDFKRTARTMAQEMGQPEFTRRFAAEHTLANEMFFEHSLLHQLRDDVIPLLYDDFGHGIEHAKRVAIDAATLVMAEVGPRDPALARKLALLALVAGVLHDAVRLEDSHPERGADVARSLLADYPLEPWAVEAICRAVACHEKHAPNLDLDGDIAILAAAVHDADLMRWGPDFFVTALWETMDYEDMSNADIIDSIPRAAENLQSLKTQFRTPTGQSYGPEMLDIGQRLYERIMPELEQFRFSPDLNDFHG